MSKTIYINIAFEGYLDEAVIKKILKASKPNYEIKNSFYAQGYGNIKRNIDKFNKISQYYPYFVLTDLNLNYNCPPELIKKWLKKPKSNNLLFRVAVKEVESWLLADRINFSKFIGRSMDLIPPAIEDIEDPKGYLIDLVRKSRNRKLQNYIVPKQGSTASQGPNYNDPLIEFVQQYWDIKKAYKYSPSLQKTIDAINNFKPIDYD